MHLEREELGENVKAEVRENDEVPLVLMGCGREFGFHSECYWMSVESFEQESDML